MHSKFLSWCMQFGCICNAVAFLRRGGGIDRPGHFSVHARVRDMGYIPRQRTHITTPHRFHPSSVTTFQSFHPSNVTILPTFQRLYTTSDYQIVM